ncbi:MAG: hypothetical protein KC933_09120 [Myxococcales bacterium]|nr:hypothetical protein [Myxococcales bacterium]MCB9646653.1 chemotaxis protein [Deltaproteobacteria bacterium]
MQTRLIGIATLTLSLLGFASEGLAQRRPSRPPPGVTVEADGSLSLGSREKQYLDLAVRCGDQVRAVVERWLDSKEITAEQLWAQLYFPIAKTNPPKFETPWLAYAERDMQPILDACVATDTSLLFVIFVDTNGYLPVHNPKYRQKTTGNAAEDLSRNRTRRIFNDQVGLAAARNTEPFLAQTYMRDNGETFADLSVPVMVKGVHFGAIRVGYPIK